MILAELYQKQLHSHRYTHLNLNLDEMLSYDTFLRTSWRLLEGFFLFEVALQINRFAIFNELLQVTYLFSSELQPKIQSQVFLLHVYFCFNWCVASACTCSMMCKSDYLISSLSVRQLCWVWINDVMWDVRAPFLTTSSPGSNSMWTFRWIGQEGRSLSS